MKTLDSLAQTVEDLKVEVVKGVFERKTIDTEELLDVIEKGTRKFIRTVLEIYAKDEFLRYIGERCTAFSCDHTNNGIIPTEMDWL